MLKQSFFVVATFAAIFAVATASRADSCADAIKAYNNRDFDRKIPQYVLNEFGTRGREREERECQLSSAMAKEGRRQIDLAKAAERACGRALELHSPDGKDDGCKSIACLEKMQKETEGRRDKACNEAVRLGKPVERAKEACAAAYWEDAVAACAKVADMREASAADKEAALMRSAEMRKHPTDDDKAIEDLTRAIALVPDDPKPLLRRALFWPLDKKDRAIEDASKAIEMNPADGQAWSVRGGAYQLKHDYAHAASDLRAATKLDPKNDSIWQELAYTYEMAKDYSNALKATAELKRLNPAIGDITENMIKSDIEFDRKMAEEGKKPKKLQSEMPKVEAPKRPSIDWHDPRVVDADDACNSFLVDRI
jgi:tetratricopeptide (TPR) repeat protein